ncbi:prepilin peptidase [Nocardioides speluncae]|uniref:prepilin peptidase n=1 Tax=Nocardioides speluncae TaxID=2670337 RepID=UPI000D69061D|nr:A24 family peptidase [Nocardioides speluncae]
MDWAANLDTAAVAAAVGAVASAFVPRLIAAVPEPEPEEAPPADGQDGLVGEADTPRTDKLLDKPKEPYADIAARPRLAVKSTVAGLVAGGLLGAAVGWEWPLTFLVFLVPVGIALAVIDFHTWLLPTWLILRAYALVAILVVISAAATQDWSALGAAFGGSLLAFGLYWVLWVVSAAMGYGDVRLSALLGLALGYLGWGELMTGIWVAFLLGTVGWIPLRLLRITETKHFPFGPFMLLGALFGVLFGADIWSSLFE